MAETPEYSSFHRRIAKRIIDVRTESVIAARKAERQDMIRAQERRNVFKALDKTQVSKQRHGQKAA